MLYWFYEFQISFTMVFETENKMQSEQLLLHYILYRLCAKWWFLTLFVHNYSGNKKSEI